MAEPVRWGILGTGGINRMLLGGARGTSAVEIVAVASRTPERAEAYAAEHAIPGWHGSYESMLADPSIEAVYISLPNALHHPWTMRALAAGKHVLCEKPYSRDPSEVEAAFDAADAAGLVLSEAFMWRHHPQAARLRAAIGELGGLEFIRSTFSFVLDKEADIRLLPELAGGSLMDVGCYCVNAARFLAGAEPVSVYGVAVEGPTGVDLRFTGLLEFPGGVTATLVSGFEATAQGARGHRTARIGAARRCVARDAGGDDQRRGRDAVRGVGSLPARARGHQRRDPRPPPPTPRPRRRPRPGTHDRCALPVRRERGSDPPLSLAPPAAQPRHSALLVNTGQRGALQGPPAAAIRARTGLWTESYAQRSIGLAYKGPFGSGPVRRAFTTGAFWRSTRRRR